MIHPHLPKLALSVRQPWTHCIMHLGKTFENRDWNTSLRGEICLHAAKGMTRDEYESCLSWVHHVSHHKPFPTGLVRRCHPTYEGRNDWTTARGAEIVFWTRAGRHIVMKPPPHPRKGTIMVGATSGYYEPEWDEECAYVALQNIVFGHFTDWDVAFFDGDVDELPDTRPLITRDLSSPSLIFAAAADIIKERQYG